MQDYYITKNKKSKSLAEKVINYVISYQNDDGSWHYSLAKKGRWIDSYHSGYVLDCLLAYRFSQKIIGIVNV